jgi:ABC-2 type transport system ATP-binding protein
MSIAVARVRGVSRKFGPKLALENVDFEVRPGEVVALMGVNGSGKSTLLRLVLGLLVPTVGEVELFGARPCLAGRRRAGFVPEQRSLFLDMTAGAQLQWWARMHGLEGREASQAVDIWLRRVGLLDRKETKVASFSKGMQQRIQLGSALVHQPDLVLLDEPFSGLDPLGREVVATVLGEERARGAGMVLCTHDLSPMESICDRVVVLSGGKKILDISSTALRAIAGPAGRLHDTVVRSMRDVGTPGWSLAVDGLEGAA